MDLVAGDIFEQSMMPIALSVPTAGFFWALMIFNVLVPQAAVVEAGATIFVALFVVALSVNLACGWSAFIIVITRPASRFVPSELGHVLSQVLDWATAVRKHGLFLAAAVLVHPFSPMISISKCANLSRNGKEAQA